MADVEAEAPVTFINTSNKPRISGAHLGLIRSHTSTVQHRRVRDRRKGTSNSATNKADVDSHADPTTVTQLRRNSLLSKNQSFANATPSDVDDASDDATLLLPSLSGDSASQSLSSSESSSSDQMVQGVTDGELERTLRDYSVRSRFLNHNRSPELVQTLSGLNGHTGHDSFRNDPFDTLPAPGSKNVHTLLDYYTQTFSKQMDWIYGEMARDSPHMKVILPLAIQVPYHFHTVLVLCRLFQMMASGQSPNNDALMLHYRSMALRHLQASLGDVGNEALPLAVVAFISIDWMLGNMAAVAAHSAGLSRILLLRGALPKSRTAPLLDVLIDKIPCRISDDMEENQSSKLRYPTHPFPSWLCSALAELPVGFSELGLSGSISVTTIMLLGGIKSMVTDKETLRDAQWPNLWNWSANAPRGGGMKPIDELLMQGLLAFCLQHNYEPAPGRSSTVPELAVEAFSSKSDTEFKDIGEDAVALDALLWATVCVTAELAARDQETKSLLSPDHHNGPLPLHRLFEVFEQSRQLQWRRVSAILHRFWFPRHLEAHWKECWLRELRIWRSQEMP